MTLGGRIRIYRRINNAWVSNDEIEFSAAHEATSRFGEHMALSHDDGSVLWAPQSSPAKMRLNKMEIFNEWENKEKFMFGEEERTKAGCLESRERRLAR